MTTNAISLSPATSVKLSLEQENSQKKPLMNEADKTLALNNVVTLGLNYGLTLINPNYALLMQIPQLISSISQLHAASATTPKNKTSFEKVTTHPYVALALLGNLPYLNQIKPIAAAGEIAAKAFSLSLLSGVLRNSVPKFFSSLKEVTKRPFEAISSAALHAFNAVAQVHRTNETFDYLNNQDSNPACSNKPASHYEKMDDIKRFNQPELNTQCPSDAVKALKVDSSINCQDLKKSYRSYSLKLHPDKSGKSQEAQDAFIKMTAFVETLKKAQGCSG